MKNDNQALTPLVAFAVQKLVKCWSKIGRGWAASFVALIVFFAASPAFGQGQLSTAEMNDLKEEFFSRLKSDPLKYAADIPKLISLQSKFKTQLQDGGLFFQGMNSTVMNNRNSLFNSKPCLADLTVRFYLNVMEKHLARSIDLYDPMQSKWHMAGGKPSLDAKTLGEGQAIGSDGWVWREALETAGGNADLAMIALSTWTHDDRYISLEIKSTASLAPKTLERLKNLRALVHRFHHKYPEGARDQLTDIISPVFAPNGSVTLRSFGLPIEILLPGSLGREIDIEDSLRSEIVRIQAPIKGASSLPAKYYHVYGGATSGCSLRQMGLSPDVSALIQAKVAEVYRNKRLCSDVLRIQSLGSRLKKDEGFLRKELDRILAQKTGCEGDDEDQWKDSACILSRSYFGNLPPLGQRHYDDPAAKTSRIAKIMDRIYAVEILAAIAASASRDINNCRSNGRLVRQDVVKATNVGGPLCGQLTHIECSRGLNTLATWKIDFDWTVAQQSVGATFGASRCKPATDVEINAMCLKAQSAQGQDRR